MKALKWIGLATLAAILGLVGVLIARTLSVSATAGSATVLVEAPAPDAGAAAARLGEALRFQTISVQAGDYDAAAFDAFHAFLRERYPRTFAALTVERPLGHTLLMTWPGTDPTLAPMLLLAHQDVVPVESASEAKWTHPPFAGVVADGVVWGRGALDDKGSLLAILEACEALLAQGFSPTRTVKLAFGHDEEVLGAGAAATAKLLANRGVKAWFALDEGMVVLERFPVTGAPAALIGVAEKGYLTVMVKAADAGGHSSMPPDLTAAEKVAKALMAIHDAGFPGGLSDGPARMMVERVAPSLPFAERLALSNLWLFGPLVERQVAASPAGRAMLATTVAPTMLRGGVKENVLPQEAWAIVNLRLHPRDTVESALARLKAVTAGIGGVSVMQGAAGSDPSPVSAAEGEAWDLLSAAVADVAPPGAPVLPSLVLGATDARHYAGVAENVYRFSPMVLSDADIATIHGTDERISVENVGRMGRFYARLIATGAGPSGTGGAS